MMATDNTKPRCANCGGINMTYVVGNDFTHSGWRCDKCGRMDDNTAYVGMMQTKRDILNDPGATLTTANMDDRTVSYTIPQMARNNVVINITGGCEYCMAEKRIMEHHGIFFNAYCVIFDGKLDVSYDNNDKDEWVCGHKAIKINYCPMCGNKLEVEE